MKKILFVAIMILVLPGVFMAAPVNGADMTVSAAASLTNAFDELAAAFEKTHPGLKIHTNYAASNPLLRQLVEGAPVDVFASADQATMDQAVAKNVVDPTTRSDFALNDLVLIVPKGAPKPTSLERLASLGRIAIGNPDSVPAGRYTKQSLEHAGLWDKLSAKYVPAASVRQVLDYVARGETDAGFVYATDAIHQADKVDMAMKVEGHEPVSYPMAVAVTGGNPKAGAEFIKFVLSPEGKTILSKYGFSEP